MTKVGLNHLLRSESETVEWKRSFREWEEIVIAAVALASQETAKRDLAQLVKEGILVMHRAGRSTVYKLIGSLSEPISRRRCTARYVRQNSKVA